MTPDDVRELCTESPTVPLWPVVAKALGLGRTSAYQLAQAGKIPTVVGHRKRVPSTWLLAKLGLVPE
jgi:hypothetical protein